MLSAPALQRIGIDGMRRTGVCLDTSTVYSLPAAGISNWQLLPPQRPWADAATKRSIIGTTPRAATEQRPAAKDPTYSRCRSNDVMPESKERMRSRSSCTTRVSEEVVDGHQHQGGLRVRERKEGERAPLLLWTISPAPRWWVPAGEAATGLLRLLLHFCAYPRRQKMGRGGW